jgi:hypothetical protein
MGAIAVGQWIKRAGPVDRARLRLAWNPMTGQFRVPDAKTIRVALDRSDPRALAGTAPKDQVNPVAIQAR